MRHAPEIIEVDSPRLEEVLGRAEQALTQEDVELIRAVVEAYRYVVDLVDDKNTSIGRLRQLLFGSRTEKTNAVLGRKTDMRGAPPANGAAADTESASGEVDIDGSKETDKAPARKGHGRNGADAYRGAAPPRGAAGSAAPHACPRPGDPCPACERGAVYDRAPGVLVRITGQPPLAAVIYQLQKLRCHLCGQVFTAPAPAEADKGKYD